MTITIQICMGLIIVVSLYQYMNFIGNRYNNSVFRSILGEVEET